MSYNEFEIISKYFKKKQTKNKHEIKGIGDDSALIKVPRNNILAISTDTLVEGIHFLKNIKPKDLAYKTVAVNLSDLAAMGACPQWITLALTIPQNNTMWLNQFSKSFFSILNKYHIKLIGGDTNRGSLSITLSAYGFLKEHTALLRNNAKIGDLIYVTGTIGDSSAGLALLKKKVFIKNKNIRDFLIKKHLHPVPRILEGMVLKNIANSAIDISDGLISDLGHILKESQCGAEININKLPISKILTDNFTSNFYLECALTAGEDYELCFTISKKKVTELNLAFKKFLINCTCIGHITPIEQGFNMIHNKKPFFLKKTGFVHFK